MRAWIAISGVATNCHSQNWVHDGHQSPGDNCGNQQHGDSKVTDKPSRAPAGYQPSTRWVTLTLLFLPDRMHSSILCWEAGQWICGNIGDEEQGCWPHTIPSHGRGPRGNSLR